MIKLEPTQMIEIAAQFGLDEEIQSYARHIQRILSADGDGCPYEDALEMAYNELILPKIS
jgi:hypothetical protein